MHDRMTHEVVRLACAHMEQQLSPVQTKQLEEQLLNTPQARTTYIHLLELAAALHWQRSASLQEKLFDNGTFATVVGSAIQLVATEQFTQTHPLAAKRFPLRLPIVTTRLAAALLCGVLVTYFAALAVFVSLRDRSDSRAVAVGSRHNDKSSTDRVAYITSEQGCIWQDATGAVTDPADTLREGQPLFLKTGTAEVILSSEVRLVLEGPTSFHVPSAAKCELNRGRLLVHVPTRAVGFTVTTPTAAVVDLGTEFGVEVSESGTTDVQVLKGKIELHPGGRSSDSSRVQQPITLSAGSAVRVEPAQAGGSPVVRKIAAKTNRFTNLSEPNKSRRIAVSGAMASSEWPTCEVRHLIDGSGMRGDSHGAVATDTMWLTVPPKVKNEFVLFDLGRFYRLESMKVWNHNDFWDGQPYFNSRGVKQADIYVSSSGKWDPVSHPDHWKLVVGNHRFAAATGKPDYASPDVIELGNVEARFVAIVIDTRLLELSPEYACVGLSEVQFFGKKVTTPRSPMEPIAPENYVKRERTRERLPVGSGIIPSSVPGLVLWLDAGAGAKQVDGREATDETEVVEWEDCTDALNNTVAENATKNNDGNPGPIFVASGIGGQPALMFKGSSVFSRLENSTQNLLKAGSPRTVIAVGVSAAHDPGPLFTFQRGLPHFEVGFHPSGEKLNVYGSEKLYFFGAENLNPGNIASINIACLSILRTPFILFVESSGVGRSLRVNINGTTPSTTSDGVAAEDAENAGFMVGAVHRNPATWAGLISEILVYDHVLSEIERNNIDSYLGNKYQIKTSFTGSSEK